MMFLPYIVHAYFMLYCGYVARASSDIDPRVLINLNKLATDEHLISAVKYGEDVIDKSKRMESMIAGSRVRVVKGGISYAQIIDGYPTPSTRRQDYVAQTILRATLYFVNSYCAPQRISSYECGQYLSGVLIPQSKLVEKCRKIVDGKTYNDEYRRLLPASYHDGIYQFRKSVTGKELPHPRSVSIKFHDSLRQGRTDDRRNVALVQWTQFIEHDLAKTTVQTMHDGTDIECCTSDYNSVLPRYLHPSCKPLTIAENDSYYKTQHVTCLNYVRSALSLGDTCKFGPANQLNQATNQLDLSQLYGNHEAETMPLRTNVGGKLKSQTYDSTEYLLDNNGNKLCVANANATTETICYSSGDSRVNINPYITLLHTLFLRSHNKIAKHLALVNPHWTDEQLFKMARSINIKIYQKIVRDWTEAVLGRSVEVRSDISEPRVSNEFATAAIRFYNTMMPGEITNLVSTGRQATVDLEDLFYRPKDLRKKEYFGHLINSVLRQNAMSLDTSYVDDMAQLLFKTKNVGTDVLALDIQRGRDHGLQSYASYHKHCTGRSVESWNDLQSVINSSDLDRLKSIYASVKDVDLIIGAVAEKPANPQSIVGPTLACIIQNQMAASLSAERSHYHRQIESILANYSAARFLCDTAQLEQVQRNIFLVPSVDNPLVGCSQIPALDLNGLREAL